MFVPSEGVEHRRLGEKNRNVKLTRKATHEGERFKSHQEQFATLRTKLLLLESEAMFTTEATRALREKQKSLLGNMRYADAFDNMKKESPHLLTAHAKGVPMNKASSAYWSSKRKN